MAPLELRVVDMASRTALDTLVLWQVFVSVLSELLVTKQCKGQSCISALFILITHSISANAPGWLPIFRVPTIPSQR